MNRSAPSTVSVTNRPLFGGAISCDIPSEWLDVSNLRQVPDHQECFKSTNDPPTLLVVEILEQQQSVSEQSVVQFYFQDLAETNGVASVDNIQFHPIDNASLEAAVRAYSDTGDSLAKAGPDIARIFAGVGFQKDVALGVGGVVVSARNIQVNLQKAQSIRVDLVVIRLVRQNTDILVTLSTPILNDREKVDGYLGTAPDMHPALQQIFPSLMILDWELFG